MSIEMQRKFAARLLGGKRPADVTPHELLAATRAYEAWLGGRPYEECARLFNCDYKEIIECR